MDEQLEFVRLIASRLEAAGIPYMLTGSVALAVYATPRLTRDVDVVIACGPSNAGSLVAAFQADSYVSAEAVAEALSSRGMFNIIHEAWVIKADFIVRKDDAYRLAEFERRRTVDLGGFTASFVAPEDLILSKLVWARTTGSEVQRRDVRELLAAVPDLDWDYLRAWAPRLGVWGELEHERR
ncbi:MAG: hypothetical protein A2083_00490 [Gemmatimonadetes bacterium GWC2_71_9]|nr:MAG: hypothetical protein A2083_00490 [Gemmatimonadetes bacterium GWC2_71_9]OGT96222.1 MAG: hypothetical protein A3I79_02310 [Gemmatimonadetes bacterium RIFCSPLOWO2_02_FULL_71_11]